MEIWVLLHVLCIFALTLAEEVVVGGPSASSKTRLGETY
jgi:hypothetical protein